MHYLVISLNLSIKETVGYSVLKDEIIKLKQLLENTNITFEQLLQLRSQITKLYVDNGYITSGAFILNNQDIARGVVQIQVVEGELEGISILGLQRLQTAYVRSRIARLAGKPVNQKRLEEALQLLQLDPLIESEFSDLDIRSEAETLSFIISLLSRFYDVSGGAIKIDDIDIRKVTQASLRRQIGVVSQDTMIFSCSVAENIAFGNPQATTAEIEAAAKIANIHDFILTLPQGYKTQLGERGINLSKGQQQLISIARAVLINPRILILDEATSTARRK